MKRKLLSLCSLLMAMNGVYAQCAVTSAPTNNCTSFADTIDSFTLNGTSATGVTGCSTSGYGSFATPVWNLTTGNTYTFTAGVGSGGSNEGFAIWIDLNNDGSYQNSEMVFSSGTPAMTHTGSITIPLSATAGNNVRMRLRCAYNYNFAGGDVCTSNISTWGETEDHFVNIIPLVPCSGTPGANSVVTPSYNVCAGTPVALSLANTYTNSGISYQWQYSTSTPVGPWTSVNNATTTVLTATTNVSTWYSVQISCAGGSSIQATSGQVNIGGQVISTVPYLEDFEGVGYNGQLPNCSWAASSSTNVAQTYTATNTQNRSALSGNKFAAFSAATGTNYFYTNGIQLNAGVTYSAALWYKTEYQSLVNFTDLSMLVGMTQTTAGLVPVASSNGPAFSNAYKSLSNTFVVPSSGIYYLAIKATSNGGSYYLSFDDVSVTAPCSLNSPTLAVSGPSVICSGQPFNITASGANTYTWDSGAHTSAVSATANVAMTSIVNYKVVGTNTLSQCSSTVTKSVIVNESPEISVFMNDPAYSVCPGETAALYAFGSATSYTWSTTGTQGYNTTVSPAATSVYTVIGTNAANCVGSQTVQVSVKTAPTVGGTASKATICQGESVVLTGTGADTYTWVANSVLLSGGVVNASPNITTNYVLTGLELASNCTNTMAVTVNVDKCVGINKTAATSGIRVYPNPGTGLYTVEFNDNAAKSITVMDLTGRVILSSTTAAETLSLNISAYANGVYYVKIQSAGKAEVIKVVKQ